MPIITLTTDFGEGSPYVAQMKGAILKIAPVATIVDVTHSVVAQDVRQGALVLEELHGRFPAGTIHVAVIDPGVGTERPIVHVQIGDCRFIAPDNGLLTLVAQRDPPKAIVRLDRPEFWQPQVSPTFHGRDIMAPAAAHLATGVPPEQLGSRWRELVLVSFPEVVRQPRKLVGQVVLIDSFGNLITNITAEMVPQPAAEQEVRIECGDQQIPRLVRTYGHSEPGTLVALFGSSDRLEIAVVNGHAGRHLAAGVGTRIIVQW